IRSRHGYQCSHPPKLGAGPPPPGGARDRLTAHRRPAPADHSRERGEGRVCSLSQPSRDWKNKGQGHDEKCGGMIANADSLADRYSRLDISDLRAIVEGSKFRATMEPDLITDPKLLDVLDELIRREPIFHRPE